jgi:glutamyl/glutaminyl-tRNA synthetase
MVVTRFSPTVNGNLHLGHIYTILVNEGFAHNNGGKFYVRFDDTSQAITLEMEHQEHTDKIIDSHKETIEWLGIEVDGWQTQSKMLKDIHEKMSKYDCIHPNPYPHTLPTFVKMMGMGWIPYPYAPFETPERVIMDNVLGVTDVIRGEEFSTEYSLYRFYCDLFDYPYPKFIFLPRLMNMFGDVSKTNKSYTIIEMRAEGYSPNDIKTILRKACLVAIGDDWLIHNLKPNPRVNI